MTDDKNASFSGKGRLKSAAISLALLSLSYGLAFWLILTSLSHIQTPWRIASLLPLILGFSFVSYVLRFLRWHWLMHRQGQKLPLYRAFFAYIAGFAFTASPGKLGELVRVRYFSQMGTRGQITVASFIFERLMDLAVLLTFSLLLARQTPAVGIAIIFVAIILIAILILARWRGLRSKGLTLLLRIGWRRPALVYSGLLRGIAKSLALFRTGNIALGFGLGLAAWAMQAMGFVVLIQEMKITVPPIAAFAIQPAATLLGAASMIPGGIATTELATVFLLSDYGVSAGTALIAAIVMRTATLWFSVLLGVISLSILEIGILRRTNT